MSLAAADRVVRALHSDERHGGSRFEPLHHDDLAGVAEVPGLLYSYPERDREQGRSVRLYVYLGVGSLGGALWEQEIRVLERVSSLEHPALPRLVGGGHVTPAGDAAGAAYLRVAVGRNAGDGTDIAAALQEMPDGEPLAIQHLWQLADALAVLHDSRVVHRNLWPGTLTSDQGEAGDADSEHFRIRLGRFEMSSMLANLLRSSRVDAGVRTTVQRFYRDQDPRSRAFAPPERLDFIFGTSSANLADERGDVFSLAMIGAEWLLGPQTVAGPFDTKSDVLAAQQRVRTALVRSTLPVAVRTLLGRMLDEHARNRPTAYEVTEALTTHFASAAVTPGGAEGVSAPYMVVFMPGEAASDKTLMDWGYIAESSQTPEGRAEVVALIERDMDGASVLHSPEGAVPYVRSGDEGARRRATSVIVGHELLWFVEHFWMVRGFGGRREVFDHAVVVKYVLEHARHKVVVRELQAHSLPRRVFKVEAVSSDHGDAEWFKRQADHRPSWRPLTEPPAVRGRARHSDHRKRLAAMDWYLEYQGALLEARTYPFVRRAVSPSQVVLAWDRDAEQERQARLSGLRLKVVTAPDRPTLADLADAAAGDDDKGVRIQLRDAGAPDQRWTSANYLLLAVRGAEEVVLDTTGRPPVPARGWLRLADDAATWSALARQGEARLELEGNPALLGQLVRPEGRATRAWAGAGGALRGEGAEAVVDILDNQTMFALQGPPGTGKTEVTSEAIWQFLLRDRGARVLVSAQSHDAVDNLAERTLRKLRLLDDAPGGASWLALRVAGERARDALSDTMGDFLEEPVVRRLVDSVRARSARWLRTRYNEQPGLESVVRSWREVVRHAELDLRLRLRRGANLVFATTGAATRENLVTYGSAEPFDWVVVEEAARAWPTELALPLVRGTRWTLVGDQAQIGPYSGDDIKRFLDQCVDDPDDEVRAMGAAREDYVRAFETFGSMFHPGAPSRTLTEQYRMRPAIAEVVSAAFYSASGGLRTMRDDPDHLLSPPGWVDGTSLVWLDTEAAERAEGFWRNELEVNAVVQLYGRIERQLAAAGLTVAVLSPYRRQCADLGQWIDRRLVHTVDGFQGREADVVIASLVRDRPARDGSIAGSIGHVAHPPRANVLLSRARELLVIVGRLEVYERHGGPHWATVVDTVRRCGRVVPLSTAGLV